MSDWNMPQIIELADGTKCVCLEDFVKNEGYKELYEVAKGRIEQLRSERNKAREALREIKVADWKTSRELQGIARRALEAAK
jgi:hypothetical protein